MHHCRRQPRSSLQVTQPARAPRGTLRWFRLRACLLSAALLVGCVGPGSRFARQPPNPVEVRAVIDSALPAAVSDRTGWAADIAGAFIELGLPPTHENACAVVAVIQQESGFQADPVIPGLGRLALRTIDTRASHAGVPPALVHAALDLKSSDGQTYIERIRAARTEKQLSDVYDDFIGRVPLGHRLFESWNPIRTRGPMQVNVAFAERLEAVTPYPFHDSRRDLRRELFTRRASIYFGTAHLLDYQAPYDRYLYRFADYNAGQYASRNAAFQRAASIVAGKPLTADGALLAQDPEAKSAGSTERVLLAIAPQLRQSAAQIHEALEQGRSESFESTALYRRVFMLADRKIGRRLPRAILPRIRLEGPKIVRPLTTGWYARRVNGRFERCLRG
ncbi:MAG: DUF1615 domain-containing protein [Gammaproteobacteria bacterium]|nr:DUF1615 domain-containing protein [Gammaproteobacteria bacterium]